MRKLCINKQRPPMKDRHFTLRIPSSHALLKKTGQNHCRSAEPVQGHSAEPQSRTIPQDVQRSRKSSHLISRTLQDLLRAKHACPFTRTHTITHTHTHPHTHTQEYDAHSRTHVLSHMDKQTKVFQHLVVVTALFNLVLF